MSASFVPLGAGATLGSADGAVTWGEGEALGAAAGVGVASCGLGVACIGAGEGETAAICR